MTTQVLDATVVQQFWRDGWVKLDGVLDEGELQVLEKALASVEANPPSMEEQFGLTKEQIEEIDPVAQADDTYAQVLRAYRETRWLFPEVMEVLTRGRLVDVVCALLGRDRVRLYSDSFLIKPPQRAGSRPTPWHQDWPLIPFDRRECLNVWIAARDVPLEAGCLEFIPRSHRLGSFGVQDFAEDAELDAIFRPEDREVIGSPVPVPLKAGDAVAFQAMMFHHAGVNRSDDERVGFQTFWIGADVRYTGQPNMKTDALGLKPGQPFEHERFPLLPLTDS